MKATAIKVWEAIRNRYMRLGPPGSLYDRLAPPVSEILKVVGFVAIVGRLMGLHVH